MSIISDIEALRFLREPDYSKRVAKIVNNCRDLNDELIQLRQQVKFAEAKALLQRANKLLDETYIAHCKSIL